MEPLYILTAAALTSGGFASLVHTACILWLCIQRAAMRIVIMTMTTTTVMSTLPPTEYPAMIAAGNEGWNEASRGLG